MDEAAHKNPAPHIARLRLHKLVHKGRTRCPISEPHSLICISSLAPWPRTPPQPPSPSRGHGS